MKTFLLKGIPEDLMRRFKSACANEGRTMKAVLLSLMGQYIKG